MTMLKILSAALIATAMLASAASARESHMHERHAAHHASGFPFADGIDGHPWMSVPPVGSDSAAPSDQPGGICDHGDDPQIC
ncbi:hypothetical protein [Bradyrhizobium sp. USDA 3364]